jgi:hypothetical protein
MVIMRVHHKSDFVQPSPVRNQILSQIAVQDGDAVYAAEEDEGDDFEAFGFCEWGGGDGEGSGEGGAERRDR